MSNIEVLLQDVKQELYSEPSIKEYFRLKEIIKNNDDLALLEREVLSLQKKMCENMNNDEIYKSTKEKYEEKLALLNSNPIYQNFLTVKEEVTSLLLEVSEVLKWLSLLQDQHA